MPSLLETAQALEQSLLARFAAASSPSPSSSSSSSTALPALPLHPLHAAVAQNGDPNSSVAALRAQVQATLQTLRSGLAEFPLAAMDDPVDETANATSSAPNADVQQRRLARDRYLVQLRDAAHFEAAILRLTSSTASNGPAGKPRRRVEGAAVAQDDRWPVRTPGNGGAGGAGAAPTSTLQLLEEVAAELGLVTFRDDDAGAGGGPASAIDTTMSAGPSAPVTLSLGGKVMVIDFSVLPASDGSSGRVEHVKVAYVAAGQDRQAHSFASKLEALFRYSSTRAEGEVEAARQTAAEKEQVTWKGVRRVLAQLKQLDEATEKSGRDAFQELDQLGQGLAEQVVTAGFGLATPRVLTPFDSLYPTVIYHATPSGQLSSTWSRLTSTADSTSGSDDCVTSSELSAALTGRTGIHGLRFELADPVGAPAPFSDSEQAHQTGGEAGNVAAVPDASMAAKGSRASTEAPLFSARLEPPVPICAATGRAVLAAGGSGSGIGSPLRSAAEASVQAERGYLAEYLPASSLAGLFPALELLAEQAATNALVEGLVDPRFGVRRVDAREGPAMGKGLRGAEEKMTLDELFAPFPPDAPLIVPLAISTRSTSFSSSRVGVPQPQRVAQHLVLSFPFPALENAPPALLGLPLSLSLSLSDPSSPSPSSAGASPRGAGAGARRCRASLSAPDAVWRHLDFDSKSEAVGADAMNVDGMAAKGTSRTGLERMVERVVDETGFVACAVEVAVEALRRSGCGGSGGGSAEEMRP
ncbi:hypothetical protein JCM8202v2_004529 [Rhodotorula sphaerocarpa]